MVDEKFYKLNIIQLNNSSIKIKYNVNILLYYTNQRKDYNKNMYKQICIIIRITNNDLTYLKKINS